MKVIKPDTLSLLTRVLVENESCLCSLGAMAFFSLENGQILEESGLWDCAMQYLGQDEVFDAGMPKPRGEYLVYGDCYDLQGKGYARVSVRVGGLSKELDVFGERFWRGDGYTAPEKFSKIAVDWEHAYGGAALEVNPKGKGHVPLGAKKGVHPLPNVLGAGDVVRNPDHTVVPASLRAYPEHWPQRAQYQGTYNARWLENTWPGHPVDYVREHACTAPKDQRLPEFFRGGEQLEVVGMHPQGRVLQSTVPKLRARMFVLRNTENGREQFYELKTTMETTWLFPGAERGVVLFRGVTPTCDEECADIEAVLTEFELQSEAPRSLEFYRARLDQALGRGEQAEDVPKPESPPEEKKETSAPKFAAAAAAFVLPGLAGLEKAVKELHSKTDAHLADLGITREDAQRFMDEKMMEHDNMFAKEPQETVTLDSMENMVRDLEQTVNKRLEELGLKSEDVDAFFKDQEAKDAANVPDTKEIQATLQKMLDENPSLPADERGKVVQSIAAFGTLATVRKEMFSLAQKMMPKPKAQTKADAVDEQALKTPPDQDASEAVTPVFQRLNKADVLSRYAKGQSMAGTDLSGLDFSEEKLKGIDLRGAVLVGTRFADADLSGAILAEADCTEAYFSRARLEKADATGALFAKARFSSVKAFDFVAPGAVFAGAHCPYAHFTRAQFQNADFTDAHLEFADLSLVQGEGMKLYGVEARGMRLAKAQLQNSRADEQSDLRRVSARAINCTGATWTGANLKDAELAKAVLDGADFSKTDCTNVDFTLATAINTRFTKTTLIRAKFIGVNLFGASLRRADLTGARVEDVNLYGADVFKCHLDTKAMHDVLTKRTLLHPEGLKGDA